MSKHKNIPVVAKHVRDRHEKINLHNEGVRNLSEYMEGTILDPQED